jgi:hypothetical protein
MSLLNRAVGSPYVPRHRRQRRTRPIRHLLWEVAQDGHRLVWSKVEEI